MLSKPLPSVKLKEDLKELSADKSLVIDITVIFWPITQKMFRVEYYCHNEMSSTPLYLFTRTNFFNAYGHERKKSSALSNKYTWIRI